MFANNLTDKLTGLLKYEIISIIVIKGSSIAGTPLGTNILKYLKPCFAKPIIVTAMKINTKRVIDPQSPSSKNLEILNNYKELWSDLGARLNDFLHNIPPDEEFSIYGSGFYGSYIFSCLEKRKPKFFLDRNSKKDQSLFGIPVIKPSDNPVNINYIFVALNPNVAMEAIKGANIKDIQKKNLFYI